MQTEMTTTEWMEIQKNLKKVAEYRKCPEGASFSMAGEYHRIYTDGVRIYKTVDGNGFGVYYKYEI